MPSVQRGQLYRRNGSWGFRYYEADGIRRRRGGFQTRKEALQVLDHVLDGVRLGPLARRDLTVQELVDEYLEQHIAENNTIGTLTARLKYLTATFGETKLERLVGMAPQLGAAQAASTALGLAHRESGETGRSLRCSSEADRRESVLPDPEPRTKAEGGANIRRLGRARGCGARARLTSADHRRRYGPSP
jgi:hypothetical protein